MSFDDYLRLLDWTGRQWHAGKRGVIPADLAPILTRLQVTEEGWMKLDCSAAPPARRRR